MMGITRISLNAAPFRCSEQSVREYHTVHTPYSRVSILENLQFSILRTLGPLPGTPLDQLWLSVCRLRQLQAS